MPPFAQDFRYAARGFARSPGFAATAILSIAIGVGANTAIFSVASALLLRPLPYADADRLVIVWNRSPGLGITEDWFSTAQYFDIRNGHSGFEDVAIAIGGNYNLTGGGAPERIGTIRVSSNLPAMLGVRPLLGSLFEPADDVPGRTGAAVLGYGTWMRRYGGDPAVVGRSLTLNGQPYEIRGVLPASFDLPREVMPTLGGAEHTEIMIPLPLPAEAAGVRKEVGIRMALGATPGEIVILIVWQGLLVTLVGIAVGLAGAFAATRVLAALLFDVNPTDATTFIAIAAGLGAVALLASYLPARRAARVDPVVSLRAE